ncbi:hypothetical protein LCGC14_0502830 [marine sediment metagenome]|uniref:Sulfotransferase domain-containing protein n=1 Tax=marine sediment metagenome TaxID=412755 RepID=A0A0F9S3F5_9ZZZZ
MIVMILGMSKSGTTLAARTLDAAGINFSPEKKRADYPSCPYENLEGCRICMEQIEIDRKKSLYYPTKIKDSTRIVSYIKMRSKQDRNWGFKFPYLTFVYHIWKKYLPEDHIAIALKRTLEGLLWHYSKKGKIILTENKKQTILNIQEKYNNLIDNYGIPVIQFEDFINKGPIVLEKIIGRKLPDVRDGKKH